MKRSLTLAEDLEISEKCSVALTDANFKNIIESNGECADVGCYVQNMCSFYSIPTIRSHLGGSYLLPS